MLRIVQPIHARNVNIGLGPNIHGARLAPLHGNNEDANNRIRVARDRIALQFRFPAGRREIDQRILRDFAFVHLQIGNRGGIRRPPIRGLDLQLFEVHPVQLALASFLRTAARYALLFAVIKIHEPKIVVAHEAYELSVGRNLGISNRRLARNQRAHSLRFQIEPCERRWTLKQNSGAARGPLIFSRGAAPEAGSLSRFRRVRRKNRFELVGGNKKPAFSVGSVHHPEFRLGLLPCPLRFKIAKLLPVGCPRETAGQSSTQARHGVDTLYGERFSGCGRLLRRRRKRAKPEKKECGLKCWRATNAAPQVHAILLRTDASLSRSVEKNKTLEKNLTGRPPEIAAAEQV